jgi:hypothetical protein
MSRPLSPLELTEMAERLPSKRTTKTPRKATARKASAKVAGARRTKRRK